MKTGSIEILEYLYKNKAENGLNGAILTELPNTDSINELYPAGYIDIVFNKDRSIKEISITGKGISWIKENAKQLSGIITHIKSAPSDAQVNNNLITIQIRDEIYDHIKSFIDSKHYFSAVEESYKIVREKLKEITGEEAAAAIFGENALNNSHWDEIFGTVPESGTPESDFARGTGYIHLAVQYLRNEKTHTPATSLDLNLAIHYISLASLAYDLIDRN